MEAATAPLGDDVGVLLQTYDALEAFLREMDALDHDGELALTARPNAPPSPLVSFSQQLVEHSWDVAPIKTEASSADAPTVATAAAAIAPATSAGARKRKFELREQALAMETQLAQLQAAMPPPASSANASAPKSRAMELWERRAMQSRQRKRATEHENARLREIASKELKVSLEIEKMLIKCYTSSLAFLPLHKNEDLALDAHDVLLYEMLEKNADARFRELEQRAYAFPDGATAPLTPLTHASRIVHAGDREAGVEFTRSQLMPFDSESVREVSWRTMVRDDDGVFTCKSVRTAGNMIAMHARMTIHREREGDIELDAHHVFKRFCSDKRTTMTWEGVTQWRVANAAATLCLPTRETGWGTIEPVAGSTGATPVTQSRMCASTLPTNASDGESVDVANLLRDLIIPAMDQVLVAHQQVMENALLDDALRRK